ncbi:MAG: hypothetical protein M0005_17625 [Actinomycetota bacterium]|nr:hypothetical protein [Actinomycetota bacterium]
MLPLDQLHCRLLSRTRTARRPGTRLTSEAMWPVTFAMTRRMPPGIKQRAEGTFEEHDGPALSSTLSPRRPA